MRIFLPFTGLRSETYSSLPGAILVPLIDREYGYGQYFQDRWKEKAPFISVEQDVVPQWPIIESMWACPSEFCFTSYMYPGQPERRDIGHLGCCKISYHLIKRCPDLFDGQWNWVDCEFLIWSKVKDHMCYHGAVLHLHIDSLWPSSEIEKYCERHYPGRKC